MKPSTKLWIKGAVLVVGDFLLIRVAGPNLINEHDDMMFGGALLCMVGVIALTAVLLPSIVKDVRALFEEKR